MQVQHVRRAQMGIRILQMVTKVAIRNVISVYLVGIISVQRTVPRNQSVLVVRIKPHIPCIMAAHPVAVCVEQTNILMMARPVVRLARRRPDMVILVPPRPVTMVLRRAR